MCTRGQQSQSSEDDINILCQEAANENCANLLQSIATKLEVDSAALRTIYVAYLDAFQRAFQAEISKKFDNFELPHEEPWYTDYVTLKPLNHDESKNSGLSLVAKAHKMTKKACDLLSTNNHDSNPENSLPG
jgi:hypothetical protein